MHADAKRNTDGDDGLKELSAIDDSNKVLRVPKVSERWHLIQDFII